MSNGKDIASESRDAAGSASTNNDPKTNVPASASRQKSRSLAIALGLVFLVLLFYLITIFRLGGGVLNRAI